MASSQKIDATTKAIDGIARQTNLLALNATIEAARRGGRARLCGGGRRGTGSGGPIGDLVGERQSRIGILAQTPEALGTSDKAA